MSHSAIDITRQQDRPLKGRTTLRRKPAPRATHAPMREPETVAISDALEQMLENRIQNVLSGHISAKTLREIAEEGWAKMRNLSERNKRLTKQSPAPRLQEIP